MTAIKGDLSVSRNTKTTNLTLSRGLYTTSLNGTTTLSAFSPSTVILQGTATGHSLNLGDSTGYSDAGVLFLAINKSNQNVAVRSASGAFLLELQPDFSCLISLQDNTTSEGIWNFSLFVDSGLTLASPGFTFGRSGVANSGTWLLNEGVPSNKAGRLVALLAAKVIKIFSSNEDISTYSVTIYHHEGGDINLVVVGTLNVVASRGGEVDLNVTVPTGKQLGAQISFGSGKNVVAGLLLTGRSS